MNIKDCKARAAAAFRVAREKYKAAYNGKNEAARAFKEAEKQHKQKHSPDTEKALAEARISMIDANIEWENCRGAFDHFDKELRSINNDAREVIRKSNIANAAEIDASAMQLLNSGICRVDDLEALSNTFANNKTMLRIIADKANALYNSVGLPDRTRIANIVRTAKGAEANEWEDFVEAARGAAGLKYTERRHLGASPDVIISLADKFADFTGIED